MELEKFDTLKFGSSLIDIRHIWYRLGYVRNSRLIHPLEAQVTQAT